MKITPFLLFCIILVVLVTITIIGNNQYDKEGFVAFRKTKNSTDKVIVPQYTNDHTVSKIYDNIYFDENNGNLLEVDSYAYTPNSPNEDITGNTITKLIVTTRNANSISYTNTISGNVVIPKNTQPSTIPRVYSIEKGFSYPTQCALTDKYTVLYIPWDKDTYVHVIRNIGVKNSVVNPIAATNVCTMLCSYRSGITISAYPENPVGLATFTTDVNSNNNNMVKDLNYSSAYEVYQISKYVKYDSKNANLIIQTSNDATVKPTVYDRAGSVVTTNGNSVANVNFAPFMKTDELGQNMVIYMQAGKKTVIALVTYNANKTTFILSNVCRFTESGLYKSTDKKNTGSKYKFNDDGYNYDDYTSEDYMLKTKIIPPVCPTCPNCPSSTTCTNCGGNGGSGTLSNSGQSTVAGDAVGNILGGAALGAGQIVGGAASGVGNVIGGVASGVGNVAGKTVDAAGNVIGGVASGVGNVAGKTVDAAGNIIGGAIGETGSLIKGAGSGAVNLLRDTGSGIKDLLTQSGQSGQGGQVGQGGQGGQVGQQLTSGNIPMVLGTQNQYTDQYSYYGQLPSKPQSSFMPITANFASFGK